MIRLRPGQLCTINHTVYRAKRRDPLNFLSCTGCALNNYIVCPNISFSNIDKPIAINCEENGLILVKV